MTQHTATQRDLAVQAAYQLASDPMNDQHLAAVTQRCRDIGIDYPRTLGLVVAKYGWKGAETRIAAALSAAASKLKASHAPAV